MKPFATCTLRGPFQVAGEVAGVEHGTAGVDDRVQMAALASKRARQRLVEQLHTFPELSRRHELAADVRQRDEL
jgi:hypothetical protein